MSVHINPADSADFSATKLQPPPSAVTSKTRRLTGWQGTFVLLWLTAMSLFHLYTAGAVTLPTAIQRAVHLMFASVAVFLLYPATRKTAAGERAPWYDWLLAAASLGTTGYIALFYGEIARRGADPQPCEVWLGTAMILLLLEAGRRVVGKVLPLFALLFLAYCYFGRYAPGVFLIRGYSLERIIQHMYLTSEGIFGVALGVSSTFVIVFIIFGAFLSIGGGARFFSDLALALAGARPGGPAKVAVLASGLLGTINGSSVANVATTGVFTIPLMKRVGYSPEYAGAVEACASTGGQLMPPIMGAGAFIMSEFLGIPYLSVAGAALLPALLYYAAVLVNVHLRARKEGLSGLPASQLPRLADVMRSRGHLLIPVFVIAAMLLMRYTALKAGFFGTVSVFLAGFLRKETRFTPSRIITALEEGAKNALGVALACALVGLIVGTSSLTSLGLTLSNNIVALSGDSRAGTLLLAMGACLVLGMGLPTTANYIVCSTVIAPALTEMGVTAIAAHLFVFYFGIMADLTPPVCLAAFTGAGIAGANSTRTGLTAARIALPSYLLPFCFVYNPMLLMQGAAPAELTVLFLSALMGIFGLAAALEGWCIRPLKKTERVALGTAALVAISPGLRASIGAMAAIGAAAVYLYASKHRRGNGDDEPRAAAV